MQPYSGFEGARCHFLPYPASRALFVDLVGEEALEVADDQVGHGGESGEVLALVVGVQLCGEGFDVGGGRDLGAAHG